jgi:hypothetical protein
MDGLLGGVSGGGTGDAGAGAGGDVQPQGNVDANASVGQAQSQVPTGQADTGGSLLGDGEIQSSQFNVNSIMDAEGNLKNDWWKGFGDDVADKDFSKYKHITSLVKSLSHLESLAGKKIIAPKDMTDEQKTEFYKQMGVPDNADGYEFQAPENMPDGMNYNPESDKWFASKAHELGLTKDQASKLRDEFNSYQMSQMQNMQAETEEQYNNRLAESKQELMKEYGDEYQNMILRVNKTVEALGFRDNDGNFLFDATNPEAIKAFDKLAGVLGEDTIPKVGVQLNNTSTKGDLEARLDELSKHPALFDKGHPEYKKVVRERREIFKKLYPETLQM